MKSITPAKHTMLDKRVYIENTRAKIIRIKKKSRDPLSITIGFLLINNDYNSSKL